MFVRVGCATRNVCTGQVGLTRTNIREEDPYKHSLARDHCGKCLYGSAFYVSASPPRQFCMPRPLDFGRLLQSGRPGWRLLQKKGARKSWRGSASSEEGEFPVIMVLAAPQSGLKGGPVQTFRKVRNWSLLQNVNVGAGPLLWMLGRVHCSNVCTGPPLDDFWQNKHPGCDFSPSHTWTRTNIPPSQHPLFFGEKLFVRVPLRKRRGRCWYGSTSARGESAGGSRSNIHDFLCTRNHFRKLVRVGLTQMFVRVSLFKTFRKMPVQHPGCENAFSGAFQRGASCVFPPPDVGTCPLWGKKSPSGPTSRFKCWYGSAFSWSAPCWVQHSRCWSREALDTSKKLSKS